MADVCRAEQRVLLTFDVGFADIRQYDPREWPGFVVLRLGSQARSHVMGVLRRVAPFFSSLPLGGRLWVVTESEIRIREVRKKTGRSSESVFGDARANLAHENAIVVPTTCSGQARR